MRIIQLEARTLTSSELLLNMLFSKMGLDFRLDSTARVMGNAGDTATSQSFEYMFKEEFPGSRIIFGNYRKVYTKEDVTKINRNDVLFVAGGGVFLYDTFPNTVSDWQWGISEELLEEISIPIVVFAVGFNKFREQPDFNDNFNRTVTKLLEKAVFFGLRNSGSAEALKRYVPERLHSRMQLSFCPTLLFNEAFKFKNSLRNNAVGFVLAGDRLKYRHPNLNKYIGNMRKFVEYLKGMGITTVLINHSGNVDLWIRPYIAFDKIVHLNGKDSKQIYEFYSKLDMVIGERGHSQMVPFACGCKILTPISHNKLKWFLEDMGLQEYGIEESDNHLTEKLIEKFDKLNKIDWIAVHTEKMRMIADTNTKHLEFIKSKIY